MNIREFYSQGIDTRNILTVIKKDTSLNLINGPMSIKSYQDSAFLELQRLRDEWDDFLNTNPEQHLLEAKEKQYENEKKEYEDIVNNMNERAIEILRKGLIDTSIIGVGYEIPIFGNKSLPVFIHSDLWPHLTIDYEKDEAKAGKLSFRSIRYFTWHMIDLLGGQEQIQNLIAEQYKVPANQQKQNKSKVNFKDVTITIVPPTEIRWNISGDTQRPKLNLTNTKLVKKNGEGLSKPGGIFFDMAQGKYPSPKIGKHTSKYVSDLRKIIRGWFDTSEDPFYIDGQDNTYHPKFTINLKKDDERQKKKAMHMPYIDDRGVNFDNEDDEASEWLKDNN